MNIRTSKPFQRVYSFVFLALEIFTTEGDLTKNYNKHTICLTIV